MRYYIDGYNLLFQLPPPKKELEKQREWLIKMIEQIVTPFNFEVVIIFDGQDPDHYTRTHYNDLEIVYTGNTLSADNYIIQELERLDSLTHVQVITSDKGLRRQVIGLGANVISPKQFIYAQKRRLRKREISHTAPSNTSSLNDYYLKIFEERLNKETNE